MHALLHDDRGQLTLKRLWPWHQILAGGQAARLDRALAEGTSPETSARLAARAAPAYVHGVPPRPGLASKCSGLTSTTTGP